MLKFLTIIALLMFTACTAQNTNEPLTYDTLPRGNAIRGSQIFTQAINLAPQCIACHNPDVPTAASPSLTGFGDVAGDRVEGLSAHEYAYYSIVDPARFLVEGYGNAMYNQYGTKLAPQDIADLIAYILTL